MAVNMGYGHERAANPFKNVAQQEEVLIANNYAAIPKKDKSLWENSRKFYEAISRAKHIPLIGEGIFKLYDRIFQNIDSFYPRRDLSGSNFQLRGMFRMMKKGWGKDLVEYMNKEELPLLTSFFIPAFFADFHGFKNDIYCIVCDADMSRTWVHKDPKKSKINYMAPNRRVVERLKLYGVPEDKIFLTGFPLPKDNIGGHKMNILRQDLGARIFNLDPRKIYSKKYQHTINFYLNHRYLPKRSTHKFSLTFAVGGAGAQREIAAAILKSLREKILKKEMSLNLVAGIRNEVYVYFKNAICENGLMPALGKNIKIIFDLDKEKYFDKFNRVLRTTDVLWTKPSELAFFCGLGIPIIMAPPIGSQEFFNAKWLRSIRAGIDQFDPRYTNEWLFDWLESGWLAEAAMSGFLDAPKFGAYNIEKVIFGQKGRMGQPLQLY